MSLLTRLLIPSRSFCIETALPPEKVAACLAVVTEPQPWDWFLRFRWRKRRPFQGEVGADGFRVRPVCGYANVSYLPVIRGRVTPTETGSRVEGTMTITPMEVVSLALCLGLILVACLVVSVVALIQGNWTLAALWPFGVMFALFWAGTVGVFLLNARAAHGWLRETITAESETPVTCV